MKREANNSCNVIEHDHFLFKTAFDAREEREIRANATRHDTWRERDSNLRVRRERDLSCCHLRRQERDYFLLPLTTIERERGERAVAERLFFASISTDDTIERERGRESAATTSDNETSVDNDREGERRECCRRLQRREREYFLLPLLVTTTRDRLGR